MLTILGQHISLIRPSLIYKPIIYNNERPRVKYNQRPKINKKNTGKVIAICVKLKNGKIKSMLIRDKNAVTHASLCEQLNIKFDKVAQTGWQLENKNYVWR